MTVNEATITNSQGRSNFDYRMKDDYLEAWEDAYNTKVVAVSLLGKKRGTLAGKRSLTSIMSRYSQSMGLALFEDSSLPTPHVGAGFKPEIMTRYVFGRLRWTWAVEAMARAGGKGVWKAPRAEDLRTGRLQFELNGARMMYLGPTQCMSTITVATSDTDFTVGGRNQRTEGANFRFMFAHHYLRIGSPLANVNDNAGAVAPLGGTYSSTMRRVDAIDDSNPEAVTVSMDGALSAVGVNDLLIPHGSRRNTDATDDAAMDSDLAGPNGLLNLVVDSTYKDFVYSISRVIEPSLEGTILANSGVLRAFDENWIELADDEITNDERSSGDDPNIVLCHQSMRRNYVNQVKGLRMFGETITKRGYGPNLQHTAGDTPLTIKTDRDCPPSLLFVLDTNSFGWYSESEFQWVDEGERFVADQAQHEIVVVRSGNEVCRRPRSNAMVGDFIYSVSGLVPA